MLLPWQTAIWERLCLAKDKDRLPHAFLMAGPEGIGKTSFALHFIKTMLCKKGHQDQETCHTCHLIETNVHPNIRCIEPEGAALQIKIDGVREATEFLSQSSLKGQHRFLLIKAAHRMNSNAANALLKTLEEPALHAMIILMSDQWGRLPATILSRCQRLTFCMPQKEEALSWLKKQLPNGLNKVPVETLLSIAGGAPLRALAFVEKENLALRAEVFDTLHALKTKQADPLEKALAWKEKDPLILLDFLLSFVMDLVRLKLDAPKIINNIDYKNQLMELLPLMDLKHTLKLMTEYNQVRSQLLAGINLNKQLMLESVLINF